MGSPVMRALRKMPRYFLLPSAELAVHEYSYNANTKPANWIEIQLQGLVKIITLIYLGNELRYSFITLSFFDKT